MLAEAKSEFSIEVDVVVEDGVAGSAQVTDIADFVTRILGREGATGPWQVAVVLTTDDRLRALHREFMGVDEDTDVMTFPSEGEPGSAHSGGDVVVSVERAAEQAGDYLHSLHEEVAFLIVHGLLHLRGWTDETPAERDAMLSRQVFLIADVGGLISNGIE